LKNFRIENAGETFTINAYDDWNIAHILIGRHTGAPRKTIDDMMVFAFDHPNVAFSINCHSKTSKITVVDDSFPVRFPEIGSIVRHNNAMGKVSSRHYGGCFLETLGNSNLLYCPDHEVKILASAYSPLAITFGKLQYAIFNTITESPESLIENHLVINKNQLSTHCTYNAVMAQYKWKEKEISHFVCFVLSQKGHTLYEMNKNGDNFTLQKKPFFGMGDLVMWGGNFGEIYDGNSWTEEATISLPFGWNIGKDREKVNVSIYNLTKICTWRSTQVKEAYNQLKRDYDNIFPTKRF
jgi:hypothetical protein